MNDLKSDNQTWLHDCLYYDTTKYVNNSVTQHAVANTNTFRYTYMILVHLSTNDEFAMWCNTIT